jgi:Cu-processing system permease protein
MLKIFKYSLKDLARSKWTLIYFVFYLVISWGILWFGGDLSRSVVSFMNIILFICPLVGVMFGVIYYNNSSEFTLLLMAQPLGRKSIFLGQYFGISSSLAFSFALGMLIPFAIKGVFAENIAGSFLVLLFIGIILTYIFTALAFVISLKFTNRLTGFGMAIMIWLFLAVIYDGIFMMLLIFFEEYPLENLSIAMIVLNPIDVSRILIMLDLDISALMGYTGAVFNKFFGRNIGMSVAFVSLLLWVSVPVYMIKKLSMKNDF